MTVPFDAPSNVNNRYRFIYYLLFCRKKLLEKKKYEQSISGIVVGVCQKLKTITSLCLMYRIHML